MNTLLRFSLLLGLLAAASPLRAQAPNPQSVFDEVSGLPYAELVEYGADEYLRGHQIPLGAMQKVRGVWRPAESERQTGTRFRFTWRLLEGYASEQLLADVIGDLEAELPLRALFSCDARACGSSAQWANRVFGERVLYGREADQSYRVFATEVGDSRFRIQLYSTARTADRQYLHAEVLALDLAQ